VWIRGHSEAKLLDADPAFHNFQVYSKLIETNSKSTLNSSKLKAKLLDADPADRNFQARSTLNSSKLI